MTDSTAPTPSFLELSESRRLAYHQSPAAGDGQSRPGVVFLGGFRSDMTGDKAMALEAWAKAAGRAFLRVDYRGHGASSGAFEEGAVGDWADDAYEAVSRLTSGPQILVGSSMGGWIALLLAKRFAAEGAGDRVAALVGIAAAPDFTEDSMASQFTEAQETELAITGKIALPSDYSDEPYVITRRLIEDGRKHLVLRGPLVLPFPVRLLQGTDDQDVSISTALQLLVHLESPDARLTLIKGAGHRLSAPDQLALLIETVEKIA